MVKNITLSAEEDLLANAREYARTQGVSLNDLMRDYMRKLTGDQESAAAAEEYEANARRFSPPPKLPSVPFCFRKT